MIMWPPQAPHAASADPPPPSLLATSGSASEVLRPHFVQIVGNSV